MLPEGLLAAVGQETKSRVQCVVRDVEKAGVERGNVHSVPTTPIFWTVCMGFLLIIPQQRCLELPTGLAHPIFKFLTISALPELKIVDLSVSTSPGDCLIYLSLGAIHGWQVYYMRPNLSVFKDDSGGSLFVLFFCLLSLSLSLYLLCVVGGAACNFFMLTFFSYFYFFLILFVEWPSLFKDEKNK